MSILRTATNGKTIFHTFTGTSPSSVFDTVYFVVKLNECITHAMPIPFLTRTSPVVLICIDRNMSELIRTYSRTDTPSVMVTHEVHSDKINQLKIKLFPRMLQSVLWFLVANISEELTSVP